MIQVSTTVRLLYCKTISKLFKKPSHVLFKDVIKKTRKQLLALLSLAVSLSKQTWAKDALFDCEGEKQTEQHCWPHLSVTLKSEYINVVQRGKFLLEVRTGRAVKMCIFGFPGSDPIQIEILSFSTVPQLWFLISLCYRKHVLKCSSYQIPENKI